MTQPTPRFHMALWLTSMLVLLAAACSGQTTTPRPTAPPVNTQTPPSPTAATIVQTVAPSPTIIPLGCTVISAKPTPGPTEQSIFPAVSDQDWRDGPSDALVTIVEYGDFQ